MISPFQFIRHPDGSMRLKDFPTVTLNTIEQQGTVTGRDWQAELGLPVYFEEWEAMATLKSDTRHGTLTFILMDESPTRLPGHPRLQPKLMSLPTVCSLELGHSGFLIGMVTAYVLDERRSDVEGDFILGHARFFDSPLAEKAMEGVRRKILTHVCPVVYRPDGAPPGSGAVLQVSVVPGDYPGCPNARILDWSP